MKESDSNQQQMGENNSHDILLRYLQHPEMLRQKLQNFVDEEKQIFGDSINEITELTNYVASNWRQIVPPVVAFGLSVLLKQTENMGAPMKTAKPAAADKNDDETLLN